MALALVWYLLVYGFNTENARILLGMFLGCSTWWVLEYVDELATRAAERRPERVTIMDRLGRFFGREPVFILVMFVSLSGLAQLTGRGHAEMQEDYFILADLPERAVVRVYSDRILAVQFDRATNVIIPNVIIRKVEKDSVLQLDKKLGPLKRQVGSTGS